MFFKKKFKLCGFQESAATFIHFLVSGCGLCVVIEICSDS